MTEAIEQATQAAPASRSAAPSGTRPTDTGKHTTVFDRYRQQLAPSERVKAPVIVFLDAVEDSVRWRGIESYKGDFEGIT